MRRRGKACTESLGPGYPGFLCNRARPFLSGPFSPLELVLPRGLCTCCSLCLECPSPRSPWLAHPWLDTGTMSPPQRALPETPAEIATAPPSVTLSPLYSSEYLSLAAFLKFIYK